VSIGRHDPEGGLLCNAVEHGNRVYLAGAVPEDITKDAKGQTQEVLAEIDRLLAKCGTDKSKVVQATIWVTDIRNRAALNEAWTAWAAPANLPVRACVEAKLADPGWLAEIMVVAAK
jgi:enamine deaminase RidA (YjgF/YER057c/UK114 family)